MNAADAFNVTARTYTGKLRGLLLFYFALLSVPAFGSVFWALGLPVVFYLLSRAGVLEELHAALEPDAPIPINPRPGDGGPLQQPGSFPVDPETVTQAFSNVQGSTMIAVGTIGVVLFLASLATTASIFAVVSAGRHHGVRAALIDGDVLQTGVEGVFDDWTTFVALYLLEIVVHVLAFAVVLLPAAVLPPLVLLAPLFAFLPVHVFFAFARSAAVVEYTDTPGALGAVVATVSFFRRRPLTLVGYSVIVLVALGCLFVVLALSSAVRAQQVPVLVIALVGFPAFDIFRTVLYATGRPEPVVVSGHYDSDPGSTRERAGEVQGVPRDDTSRWEDDSTASERGRSRPLGDDRSARHQSDSPPRDFRSDRPESRPKHPRADPALPNPTSTRVIVVPPRPTAGTPTRLRRAAATGWSELASFARQHTPLVAVNLLLFALAVGLGWLIAAPIADLFEASIERRIAQLFPPGTMLNFFANNWSVGIRQAVSGLAFGLPTFVSIVQNGVNIGLLFRLEVAPAALVAFLLPHGIFELPALWLSGALGFHLGGVVFGVVRGRVDRSALVEELDTVVDVLVGLGVLFAIAAVVEAFVSPYYWQPLLG